MNKKLGKELVIKNKVSLQKKFNEYHGKNLTKNFEWDESRGKEIIRRNKYE